MKKNLFISFLFISVLILVVGCTNNTKKALEENDPKYCEKINPRKRTRTPVIRYRHIKSEKCSIGDILSNKKCNR